uniref:Aryl hydrocarbon receptor n=1 Tax=Astyanax mexicanus TaxID=7994 RepID=A0A3B1IX86_ASTMX
MLDTDRYACKKRKKPAQKQKPADEVAKSNPSKRHRDRLNGELERLTNMLPFSEDVRSRLDKLSVLRLSVGYLKAKSFFKATMKKNSLEFPTGNGLNISRLDGRDFSEGDLLLQALNGFVLVVTAEGYIFYASPTIQDYLGFHQSDMVHQSVFEFIHVDDRAIFRRQLHFALNPKRSDTDMESDGLESSSDITRNIETYNPQHIPPENSSFLERSFVCRFRCLLDNSSGFLKLNFQGRLKFLLGQNEKAENGSLIQPQLAFFAIATPVQPPAILEIRAKTLIFQTKHKLDFTPLGIDSRGKVVLGYSEMELCMKGSGYQYIHAADMMHCADNHIRMIKTGESGMTVFRLLTKNAKWIWVQSNARLVYKGGRPDFIIARQRALVNAEGEEHLRQRRLQLPFPSLTTGEAVLYDLSSPLDVMNAESTKMESSKPLEPSSMLASLQRQDQSIYQQPTEPEFRVDDAFMDSWALFNVPSKVLQDKTKKEEEDSDVSLNDALELLAQDGDICTTLQQMEVDSMVLKECENALLRMATESSGNEKNLSLDEILTSNIFSYVEGAVYKEISKGPVPQANLSASAAGAEVKNSSFGVDSGQYSTTVNSGSGFSTNHSFDSTLEFVEITGQDMGAMVSAPDKSQRLSHSSLNTVGFVPVHEADTTPRKGLNHLSLTGQTELFTQFQKNLSQNTAPSTFNTIPSNGWENVPQQNVQVQNGKTQLSANYLSSCQIRCYPGNHSENSELNPLQNGFHQKSQPTFNHQNNHIDKRNHSPSLSPYNNCISSSSNIHTCHAPTDHPAANHCSPLSSCMYESQSPPSTNTDWLHPQAQAVTIPSCSKETLPNNQSPPQASCYFQWMPNEPVVGTSSIPQVDVCISPPLCHTLPGVTINNNQEYHGHKCNGHTQDEVFHTGEYSSWFSIPPHINGIHVPENSRASCCKL